jgi:predicted ferric reductase
MTTTVPSPPRARTPVPIERPTRSFDATFAVEFAIAAGAVVTIAMWLRHGQLSAASGPGGAATAAGQIFALLGTYAALVQVLFMSRIAWLERTIGLDVLAVWHRWLGFAVVTLLTGHVVFTTVGWAAGSIPPVSIAHETGWLIAHEPDVLMAWIGFGLFLAVAFTSVRAARRKMSRETWYFVHLYAYLAVVLSFAHQLAVGSDFDNDAAARVWWIGLYVLVAGAILWWRVLVPLRLNLRHQMRVQRVFNEGPETVSLHIKGKQLDRLAAQPGQFFLWRFLTPRDWWKPHPFSLSAAPRPNMLRITVKDLGDDTRHMQRMRPGVRVFAEGPYGTLTAERRTRRSALLLAGGIGITPLRALLDSFRSDDDVVMLYRVQREDDAVFVDELQSFVDKRGIRLHVIAGTEIGDDHTDLLSIPNLMRGVPDVRARDCYVSGPPAFVDALRARLHRIGVPHRQIHYERFEL